MQPSGSPATARDAVARAARHLAARGLVEGTAGNVSVRLPAEDLVAVTPTGIQLSEVTPADVTLVDRSGAVVDGRLQPTSELDLHLAVYARHGVGAVVHTHAPDATAVACVLDELPCVHYEMLLLGGPVPVAPYAVFGTPELAASAADALEGRNAALLANHGTVTTGHDVDAAVRATELLEWSARLFLRAASLGTPRVLDADARRAVLEAAVARGYGATKSIEED